MEERERRQYNSSLVDEPQSFRDLYLAPLRGAPLGGMCLNFDDQLLLIEIGHKIKHVLVTRLGM